MKRDLLLLEPIPFSSHEADFFHDEYGASEGEAIRDLISNLEQIKTGTWTHAQVFDAVIPAIERLRAACKERYDDK